MNNQFKISEKQQNVTTHSSIDHLMEFMHYYQQSRSYATWKLSIDDFKTNQKQVTSYYKQKNRKQTKIAEKNQQIQDVKSITSQEKVKKSTKRKMQYVPKSKESSVKHPEQQQIIKINTPLKKTFDYEQEKSIKSKKSKQKMEAPINIFLKEQSQIQIESIKEMQNSGDKYNKIEKHSLFEQNNSVQIQQSKQSLLNEFKRQNVTKICNLNQFFIKQGQEEITIKSPIHMELSISKVSRSQKVQNSKKPLLSNQHSQKLQEIKQYQENNKHTQSILIYGIQNGKSKNKNQHKSKSPNKIIKQSVLQIKKQSFYPTVKNNVIEKQMIPDPQPLFEPSTHKKWQQKSFSQENKIQVKQEDRIPVEDYDKDLDQNHESSEYDSKQFQEFYDPKNHTKNDEFPLNNTSAFMTKPITHDTAGEQKIIVEQQFRVLDNYGIDINYIKKQVNKQNKSVNNVDSKYGSANQLIKLPQHKNQSQKKKEKGKKLTSKQIQILEHQQKEKQQSKQTTKTNRRRIFSHSSHSQQQLALFDLSEEEMKMLLNAKGNKYKQAIVLQYIRTTKANGH